jgi:hypothetical protein
MTKNERIQLLIAFLFLLLISVILAVIFPIPTIDFSKIEYNREYCKEFENRLLGDVPLKCLQFYTR